MEEELKLFMESQKEFQKATLEALQLSAKTFSSIDERIKICHERADVIGKQVDTLLDIFQKLQQENKELRQSISNLQRWKLSKEGV